MTCESALELLSPYLDGELDAPKSAQVAAHLETCASCAASLKRLRGMSASIRNRDLYYAPPAWLEARVTGALRQSIRRPEPRNSNWTWLAAAGIILSAGLAWYLLMPGRQVLVEEVVANHIRSMQAAHLFDVPSEDRHTVKPWFNGKLDFSPDVKDLSAQGFPLAGGRLDYLEGRNVAALVFHRRLHVINVFVWPSSENVSHPARAPAEKGFNIVHWTEAGLTYWAVSDIPAEELEQFAQIYTH